MEPVNIFDNPIKEINRLRAELEAEKAANALLRRLEVNVENARLNAELSEIHKESRWIPIEEKLPEKDFVVWGFYRSLIGNDIVGEVYLSGDGDWYTNSLTDHRVTVLFWQEITPPEPPQGSRNE